MIRADIATAALDEETAQRVRLAASLLAAFRITAKVREWDGTRCNLLVADYADAYGRQACHLARQRGTPMLLFNDNSDSGTAAAVHADGCSQVSALAQQLRKLLEPVANADDAGSATTPETDAPARASHARAPTGSALCRLATAEFEGQAVDASLHGRVIRFRPALGRVYAPTYSDLLSARDTLANMDWSLHVLPPNDYGHLLQDGASRSLEAFLLQAAFHAKDDLPDFAPGHYRLKDWPDIGSAPELICALKIANVLLRTPVEPERLPQACGVEAREAHAALWAFGAAGMLIAENDAAEVPSAPPREVGRFSGLLGRIASRFGLQRVG